jgi:regulator of sigma E protease
VLIIVHELGHFLAAKIFRMRVERFSIGFPPRLIGKKIGDTDYCISAIPFGGYVKVAGMVDESMDKDALKEEPKPWEYRSRPWIQRFLVIFAGPLMNILFSLLVYIVAARVQGIPEMVRPTVVGTVEAGYPAEEAGLQPGDRIVSVNGDEIASWEEMADVIHKSAGKPVVLAWVRDGSRMQETVTPRLETVTEDGRSWEVGLIGITSKYVEIGQTSEGEPADLAGLKPGDMIMAVDGKEIVSWAMMTDIIHNSPGDTLIVTWMRQDSVMEAPLVPKLQKIASQGSIVEVGLTGIVPPYRLQTVGPVQAVSIGTVTMYYQVKLITNSISMLVTGKESPRSLGGPVFIAQVAGESARTGFSALIGFMAFLSINLAILNLLPIPALDGGHLVYLVIEGIIRRPIPLKVKMIIQQVGLALILALMLFVIYNDIVRTLGK